MADLQVIAQETTSVEWTLTKGLQISQIQYLPQGVQGPIAFKGKYKIQKYLDKGAYGRCYKVIKTYDLNNKNIDRIYALKQFTFPTQKLDIDKGLGMYEQEAGMMKQIRQSLPNSKYFIQISSKWKENEYQEDNKTKRKAYILIEYCSNGSLEKFLNLLKHHHLWLSDEEILYLAKEMITALSQLHQFAFMHGDIKLSNLLFDSQFNLKVCDFGLTIKETESSEKYNTRGTPRYMAPEIVQNIVNPDSKNYYNHQVDIWAAGVSIYYMTFKEFPFSTQIRNALPNSILNDPINFQSQVTTDIHLCLLKMLRQMLQKSPKSRITAKDLLQLQPNIFAPIIGKQQQIKRGLRLKKAQIKVQVKKVFHVFKIGYCFLLANNKTSILLYNGQLIHMNQELLNKLKTCQKNGSKLQAQEPQIKQLKKYVLFLSSDYIQTQNRCWKQGIFDAYGGDDHAIKNVIAIRENIILVKLSNHTVQCFFASERDRQQNFLFDRDISINFSTINRNLIAFNTPEASKVFNNFKEALGDPQVKQYLEYLNKICSIELDGCQEPVSLQKHNFERKLSQ